jgi:sugar (pentulose or hexulose) kinase
LLESAAFGHRHILEALDQAGVHVNEVRASGGGAKSDVWLQMHADVANTPVTITSSEDAAIVGCAVAASVCLGLYPDLETAAGKMVHPVRTFDPDPARHEAYGPAYTLYRELYPAVRPIFRRVAAG